MKKKTSWLDYPLNDDSWTLAIGTVMFVIVLLVSITLEIVL